MAEPKVVLACHMLTRLRALSAGAYVVFAADTEHKTSLFLSQSESQITTFLIAEPRDDSGMIRRPSLVRKVKGWQRQKRY